MSPLELRAQYLAGRPSERTREIMEQGLRRCERAAGVPVGRLAWEKLTEEHTTEILKRLVELYPVRSTLSAALTALRGILKTARDEGLSQPFDPAGRAFIPLEDPWWAGVELPAHTHGSQRGRALSEEEIGKLNDWIESLQGIRKVWARAIFVLLIDTGIRANELCTLRVNSYLPEKGRSALVIRKGNWTQQLPLAPTYHREVPQAIDAWLDRRAKITSVPWLFLSVLRNGVQREAPITVAVLQHLTGVAERGAGIAAFTPMDCRRTFCTRSLNEKTKIRTYRMTQDLMGHARDEPSLYDPRTPEDFDREDDEARARAAIAWGLASPVKGPSAATPPLPPRPMPIPPRPIEPPRAIIGPPPRAKPVDPTRQERRASAITQALQETRANVQALLRTKKEGNDHG